MAASPGVLVEGDPPRPAGPDGLRRIRADAHTRMLPVASLSASAEVAVPARGSHGPCSGG
ncbi:hypothetical protein [Myxococcus xanthus]|uniref:hypothetical protein n=1 Tax=Myxococcus xanthus TaxID=34 RepID=UPI0020A3B416|nr:hypothetical protein [Myxococcus xanthus]